MEKSAYIRSRTPRKRKKLKEFGLHKSLIHYLHVRYSRRKDVSWLHIPNGEARPGFYNKRGKWICPAGARLKEMGTRKGSCDILIFKGIIPHWLELKAPGEKPSPDQLLFMEEMESLGHRVAWTDDALQAVAIIDRWLQ